MASRQAWNDGTPNRVQMASIPHCIWRGIRSSGTPVTSSGRMSRGHAVDLGADPRLHVAAHVDHGGIGHQCPDPQVGGGRPGGEVRAEALAGQRHPVGVDLGQGHDGVEHGGQRDLVVGPERHGRIGPHAAELARDRRRRRRSTPARRRARPAGSRAPRRSSRSRPRRPGSGTGRSAARRPADAPGTPGAMPPSNGTSSALDRRVEQRRGLGEARLAPRPGVATARPASPP